MVLFVCVIPKLARNIIFKAHSNSISLNRQFLFPCISGIKNLLIQQKWGNFETLFSLILVAI